MQSPTSEVAGRVRQLRDQRGLSARELADRCIAAGQPSLTRSAIAKIESGLRFITLDELAALAQALQIAPHDLLCRADAAVAPSPSQAEPAVPAAGRTTTELAAVPLITSELRTLRKGPGVQSRELPARLGRYLRELTGQDAGSQAGDAEDMRRVVANELGACAARLPHDLSAAVMASLALLPETGQMAQFGERVAWLAGQADRNERSVLRRIDVAEQILAEEIAAELGRRRSRVPSTVSGWYLDEFRAILRLDTPTPESHERRRIVATRPGLTEVQAWLDVPPKDADQPGTILQAEVLLGGRLVRKPDAQGHNFVVAIELPRPLDAGEAHEYEVILRVPEASQMRPALHLHPRVPVQRLRPDRAVRPCEPARLGPRRLRTDRPRVRPRNTGRTGNTKQRRRGTRTIRQPRYVPRLRPAMGK